MLWVSHEQALALCCEVSGVLTLTHSFGAVMEEFELRDAIENIFSGRPEAMVF